MRRGINAPWRRSNEYRGGAGGRARRADEALATYIGERGTKRLSLEVWGWLARVPVVMRGAADAPLRTAIAELDMAGGGGQQRAAIVAAFVAYVEAHRGDPGIIPRVKALAWGLGWLSYLANIRVTSDPPLAQVVSSTQTPWWR